MHGGYPPLADLGLIGDGATAALVGLDGSIRWMCVPSFDSVPLFCALLDHQRGGEFIVAPEGLVDARQHYERDSGVLITELRSDTGILQLTDALALRSGADLTDDAGADRQELVRAAVVLEGSVRLRVSVQPRGGARVRSAFNGLTLECTRQPGLRLHLRSNRALPGLQYTDELRQGERCNLVLSWGRFHRHHKLDAEARLVETVDVWRRWMAGFHYDGPEPAMVRRAAITLKLCDHWAIGSLVAAPTSSLPAPVGGIRNWDYRYTWIRDAAFAVFAMRRIGFVNEADEFLGWVLDAFERSGQARIMYTLDGDPIPDESEDGELEGYRGSAPVRWGNGAADQLQHDVYGEVLDCADQWVKAGGRLDVTLWDALSNLADTAGKAWREPDQGIWEVRSSGRIFTYSAGMCQVALDRAATIAERLSLSGPVARWRSEAADLRELILTGAWNDDAKTLSEHLDGDNSVDASLLALPLRGVIPADHPKMIATTAAIAERLSAGDGLLYRYRHDESPDGLAGDEGAFLLCSFWLVDNLAHQGRLEEAEALYASLCARASPLGLLSEQIDPTTERAHRQLPAGLQSHRRHRERRHAGPSEGGRAMIDRLVLLGATGDLTARYLLPALAALDNDGYIGERFRLTAVGREDWHDDDFRNWASAQLEQHAPEIPAAARHAVVSACEYRRADVTDPAALAPVIAGTEPIAAYLALPPFVFPGAVSALHGAGLAPGSSIVVEKPFGENLKEAIELNTLLARVIPEEAVFRVDHFLAMTTVQNVLGTRLANRTLEPIWNSAHISEIDIVWDETLALEGRAGYYDGVGALKDMLQNHLLQLLCLVAMEPPISLDARDLRDRKVDVLRSIRPLREDEVIRHTRRARYTSGSVDGVAVPAYLDEAGVDPTHGTETFAEMELRLDNWRWHETIFRLRTGKALGRNRKEVAVHFRPVPHLPRGMYGDPKPNVLEFGLDPENVVIEMSAIGARSHTLVPLRLTAELEPPELPAYGRLLLDVFNRDPALSIRCDEAEESWRVVTPVLDAWANDLVPLQEYAAGSDGPTDQRGG
jgi:glucose-6-phosphate 1-dehydrogenase